MKIFILFYLLLTGCVENGLNPFSDPPKDPIDSAETEVTVEEPIADAGPDQILAPLNIVTLDGSASYDPNGLDIIAYKWILLSVPEGSTAINLVGETNLNIMPQLWLDIAGDYTFSLTVENSEGTWDSTPDQVVISAIPADSFYVQLTWDTTVDLDLHLIKDNGTLFSFNDCDYCNMQPNWFPGNSLANPSLDWDVIYTGLGPETITIESPNTGTYQIVVHYYGQNGFASCSGSCQITNATVRVYINGILTQTFTQVLTQQGDLWNPASINVNGLSMTTVSSNILSHTSKTGCL